MATKAGVPRLPRNASIVPANVPASALITRGDVRGDASRDRPRRASFTRRLT
jgi:hypothetical protein